MGGETFLPPGRLARHRFACGHGNPHELIDVLVLMVGRHLQAPSRVLASQRGMFDEGDKRAPPQHCSGHQAGLRDPFESDRHNAARPPQYLKSPRLKRITKSKDILHQSTAALGAFP